MIKTILLVFISTLFCDEDGPFSLKLKYREGEENKYKSDIMINFSISLGETMSGTAMTIIERYKGEKDGFLVLEQEITDIISTVKTFDKMTPNHDMNALADVPFSIYINKNGELDHFETEYKHLEEELNTLIMGFSQNNYLYPFGMDAVDLEIGAAWSVSYDSVKMFAGNGEFENLMFIKSNYTLDKVKKKRGRWVAYISEKGELSCDMKIVLGNMIMDGRMNGEFKNSYRFDLDLGKTLLKKGAGTFKWNFSMEDKNFKSTMRITEKTKKVK